MRFFNGIRTSKTINNITTNYYVEGRNIIFEDRNGTMLYYLYNGDELLGFIYNNNTYYYHKNLFQDIIGIYDSNYNEIVTYDYDSWGVIKNITDNSNINLGTINPFRYRSYYYDTETELYYLNSRYYNPRIERFLNADVYVSTGQSLIGHNMYNYCGCNPINRHELQGEFWVAVGVVVYCVGMGSIAVWGTYEGNKLEGKTGAARWDNTAGAFYGGVIGSAIGLESPRTGIYAGTLTTETINTLIYGQTSEEIAYNTITNVTFSQISPIGGNGLKNGNVIKLTNDYIQSFTTPNISSGAKAIIKKVTTYYNSTKNKVIPKNYTQNKVNYIFINKSTNNYCEDWNMLRALIGPNRNLNMYKNSASNFKDLLFR